MESLIGSYIIHTWQNMAYKKQAYIVNPIIMAVLLVIFSFVTLFKFFNYNTNILDPFQFNVILGLLHIFGIVGIVLAMGLEGDKNHQIKIIVFQKKMLQMEVLSHLISPKGFCAASLCSVCCWS